ncbi:MAG: glycosyltransferase [Ruminococcaceae bacterium]|nr:glycosyltransferase [Oscillospiraceae bacterium]
MSSKYENVAILIPAYKPDKKLLKLVDELLAAKYNVIVVNDGSGAEFDHVFNSLHDVKLLVHTINKGKGAALKTGISYVDKETSYSAIITADADGQHTLADITKLADFLCDTKEKFVIGSRKFTGNVPFKSKFGNKLTIGAYALASGVRISDTQTGLRGFSKELFSELAQINGERYEYEINVLLHVAKHKIKIHEIEIETIYIDENASSHFHPIRDSAKIYSCILKYCVSSIASFLVDFSLAHIFLFVLPLIFVKDNYQIGDLFSFTGEAAVTALATALARIFSSMVNFALNQKIVFKSKEKTSSAAVKYFALAAFVLVLNSILTVFLRELTGFFTLSYIITQIVLFVMNYFIQKKFIFKAE